MTLLGTFPSDTTKPAIIGATVAILIMLSKDLIIKLWFDNRKSKKDELIVFRQYADPLSNATMSLLWRLNEIFKQKHKSSYLHIKYTTDYAVYKRVSTVYRLASLLGWLHAFQKELALLKTKDNNELQEIKNSINEFRAALADGTHIELERLKGFMELWNFNFKDCQTNSIVASCIDNEIKDFVAKKELTRALDLTDEDKFELVKLITTEMAENYKVNKVPDDIIKQTTAQAIQLCSLKESWIYRDWQDAIGDMMLIENKSETRKYDVIGFYEFSNKLKSADNKDVEWITRIEDVFYDLDVTGANKADMRLEQLKHVVKSTSNLMLSLTANDKQRKVLMSKTIKLANKLINS